MVLPSIKVSTLRRLPWQKGTPWHMPKPGGGTVLDLGGGSTATVMGWIDESWRCTAIPGFFIMDVSIAVVGPAASLPPVELRKLVGEGSSVYLRTYPAPERWAVGRVFGVVYRTDAELPPMLDAAEHTCGAERGSECLRPWYKGPCTAPGVHV